MPAPKDPDKREKWKKNIGKALRNRPKTLEHRQKIANKLRKHDKTQYRKFREYLEDIAKKWRDPVLEELENVLGEPFDQFYRRVTENRRLLSNLKGLIGHFIILSIAYKYGEQVESYYRSPGGKGSSHPDVIFQYKEPDGCCYKVAIEVKHYFMEELRKDWASRRVLPRFRKSIYQNCTKLCIIFGRSLIHLDNAIKCKRKKITLCSLSPYGQILLTDEMFVNTIIGKYSFTSHGFFDRVIKPLAENTILPVIRRSHRELGMVFWDYMQYYVKADELTRNRLNLIKPMLVPYGLEMLKQEIPSRLSLDFLYAMGYLFPCVSYHKSSK